MGSMLLGHFAERASKLEQRAQEDCMQSCAAMRESSSTSGSGALLACASSLEQVLVQLCAQLRLLEQLCVRLGAGGSLETFALLFDEQMLVSLLRICELEARFALQIDSPVLVQVARARHALTFRTLTLYEGLASALQNAEERTDAHEHLEALRTRLASRLFVPGFQHIIGTCRINFEILLQSLRCYSQFKIKQV